MNGVIGLVSSREDAIEINSIFKLLFVSIRARKLGRDAYNRMKKGDFTNKPTIKKKTEKQNEKEKILKGYD